MRRSLTGVCRQEPCSKADNSSADRVDSVWRVAWTEHWTLNKTAIILLWGVARLGKLLLPEPVPDVAILFLPPVAEHASAAGG
jgi:hypothetical protein